MMITYEHHTLRLLGMPLFTLMVGMVFLGALAGLTYGIFRWKRRAGKIATVMSALVLMAFAVAIILVLITVGSGSMG